MSIRISSKNLKSNEYVFRCNENCLTIMREGKTIVEFVRNVNEESVTILTEEYCIPSCQNVEITVKQDALHSSNLAIKVHGKKVKILYNGKWYKYKNKKVSFFPEIPIITSKIHIQ